MIPFIELTKVIATAIAYGLITVAGFATVIVGVVLCLK